MRLAEYYQQQAYDSLNHLGKEYKEEINQQRVAYIQSLKEQGREKEISKLLPAWEAKLPQSEQVVPYAVAWCEGQLFDGRDLYHLRQQGDAG
ncbi:MAG: hypothetical protein IJ188_02125 [Clostridia bacterium]|nr:hypothetical protein [Clostridia bacterium]